MDREELIENNQTRAKTILDSNNFKLKFKLSQHRYSLNKSAAKVRKVTTRCIEI